MIKGFRHTTGLLLLMVLAGCGNTVLEWQEEVRLHDGRVIVIDRKEERGASGFPVQKRGFVQYHQFCYEPMGVRWKSSPVYRPETFDIVDGKAYVKVTIFGVETCIYHGYPETNAIYFMWENGAWKKIPYEAFPKGLRYNLLSNTGDSSGKPPDAKGLIKLGEKRERDKTTYIEMERRGNSGLNDSFSMRNACARHKGVNPSSCCSKNVVEIFRPIKSCK